MKIQIDLNEILGDENGVETLHESVRRQVLEGLTREIRDGVKKKIDAEIAKAINNTIRESIKSLTPAFIDELMNTEYTPVDRWGDSQREKTTTFRKELVKAINEQMVYKKTSYRSDQSSFTNAVDDVVSENVSKFKSEFNSIVNKAFIAETTDFAVNRLREILKV